jgi:hypothetical protein
MISLKGDYAPYKARGVCMMIEQVACQTEFEERNEKSMGKCWMIRGKTPKRQFERVKLDCMAGFPHRSLGMFSVLKLYKVTEPVNIS